MIIGDDDDGAAESLDDAAIGRRLMIGGELSDDCASMTGRTFVA